MTAHNDNMRQSPTAEDFAAAERTVVGGNDLDHLYTGDERTRIKNLAWEILRIRQHRRRA